MVTDPRQAKGVAGSNIQPMASALPTKRAHWANHLDQPRLWQRSRLQLRHHWGQPVSMAIGRVRWRDSQVLSTADATPRRVKPSRTGDIVTRRVHSAQYQLIQEVPYAPLELYMMGLVPQRRFQPHLRASRCLAISYDSKTDKLLVEAAGTAQITMSSIIARHGTRRRPPMRKSISRQRSSS